MGWFRIRGITKRKGKKVDRTGWGFNRVRGFMLLLFHEKHEFNKVDAWLDKIPPHGWFFMLDIGHFMLVTHFLPDIFWGHYISKKKY